MRLRRVLVIAGALAIGSVAASATLPQEVVNVLTAIDTVPTQPELDLAFDGSNAAQQSLASISQDVSNDIGIRLRATHALAQYCLLTTGDPPVCDGSDPAHQSLLAVIQSYNTSLTGAGVLMLRAAIEAIGPLQVPGDAAILEPLLNHPSRDIRAATARALRDLCDISAITLLRQRYQIETAEQVRLAISDALQILGQPLACQ